MWLAMRHPGISASWADALFVSALQRSDDPSTGQVRNAIAAAVREFGGQGCAEQVAQEFGDHPETAVVRMRWARALAAEACRSWSARWSCVGTDARTGTPRSGSSAATRQHPEPGPPPTAPLTSTKPLLVRTCSASPAADTTLQPVKLILVKTKRTVASMKYYGQACAIARALDVVGERWSLLLVRELALGPRRYRDLATGLPGIPSNILAARLKDLQAAGVITRRTLPAPTDVTVYELTGAGRALQPALTELLHWGLRHAPQPSPDDAAQPAWALLAAAGRPTALPAGQTCELRVGPEFFYLGSDAGTLTVRRGPAPDGDAVVTMPADTLYSLLTGQTTVTGAVRHSTVDGDTGIARRALEPLAAALTKPAPAM